MRLASITIFVAFSLALPAQAQSFNRQDLDCAVVALLRTTIKPIGPGLFMTDPN
jgi:hypothetical protein